MPRYQAHLSLRVTDQLLCQIDEWRRSWPGLPTRQDAIRQMVELQLSLKKPSDEHLQQVANLRLFIEKRLNELLEAVNAVVLESPSHAIARWRAIRVC